VEEAREVEVASEAREVEVASEAWEVKGVDTTVLRGDKADIRMDKLDR